MSDLVLTCSTCGTKNKVHDTKQHLGPKCAKCKTKFDMQQLAVPVELTDQTMDSFLHSTELPILVDFFSPTCGPCAMLAPILDQLTRTFVGKAIIAKVDTSRNPGCSVHYQIRGVPTLIFFRGGKAVDQIVGLPEKQHLLSKLQYWSSAGH